MALHGNDGCVSQAWATFGDLQHESLAKTLAKIFHALTVRKVLTAFGGINPGKPLLSMISSMPLSGQHLRRIVLVAVGVVASDDECSLLTQSHRLAAGVTQNTLVPAWRKIVSVGISSWWGICKLGLTSDDATDADLGVEVTLADGRVEPADDCQLLKF